MRGVTLVELLVVVSIAAILAAVAIPQLASFTASRAVDAQISAIAASLRIARAEALKRSIPVTICPSLDPEAAAPQCSAADATLGWATGWLVFTDLGVRNRVDGDDVVIQVQSRFSNSGGILPSAGVAYTITFSANGLTVGNLGNAFTFVDKSKPEDTSSKRYVCISTQGYSRYSKTGCGN